MSTRAPCAAKDWRETLPVAMVTYLDSLSLKQRPKPIAKWAREYFVTPPALHRFLKTHHPDLAAYYDDLRRGWVEDFSEAVRAVGAYHVRRLTELGAEWGVDYASAAHYLKRAQAEGLIERRPHFPASKWRNVVSLARVGMTRRELAAAAKMPFQTLQWNILMSHSPYSQCLRDCVEWARTGPGKGGPYRIVIIHPLKEQS